MDLNIWPGTWLAACSPPSNSAFSFHWGWFGGSVILAVFFALSQFLSSLQQFILMCAVQYVLSLSSLLKVPFKIVSGAVIGLNVLTNFSCLIKPYLFNARRYYVNFVAWLQQLFSYKNRHRAHLNKISIIIIILCIIVAYCNKWLRLCPKNRPHYLEV